MNYLDLCNEILFRLREDPMATVVGQHDDVVHDLVKGYVNDAKRIVEDAYDWTNLVGYGYSQIGNQLTQSPQNRQPLTAEFFEPMDFAVVVGVGEGGKILSVLHNGRTIAMIPRQQMAKLKSQNPSVWAAGNQTENWPIGDPIYWTLDKVISPPTVPGARAPEHNFELWLHPYQIKVDTIEVQYKRATTPMALDTDMLEVPAQPVLNYALALLARERGEVGGQTSTELFQLAQTTLSDAISLDASNHDVELNWGVV